MPFILHIVRSRRHPRHTTQYLSSRKLFMSLPSSCFHQVSLLAIDISPQSCFSTVPTHHHPLATSCWLAYYLAQLLDKFQDLTRLLKSNFRKKTLLSLDPSPKAAHAPSQTPPQSFESQSASFVCTCNRISPAAASQRRTCCHHQ